MNIRIASEIIESIPGIQIGVVVLKGLDNQKKISATAQLMRGVFAQKQTELKNDEKNKAIQHILQKMRLGKDGGKIFPEVQLMESSLRKAEKGKAPDHKSNLYALLHYASLKYMIPLFAADMDELEKDVEIHTIQPKKGKRAEDMVFSPETKNVIIWFLDIGSQNREDFEKVTQHISEVVQKYCGGKEDITFFLNADNNNVDLGYMSEKEKQYLQENPQETVAATPTQEKELPEPSAAEDESAKVKYPEPQEASPSAKKSGKDEVPASDPVTAPTQTPVTDPPFLAETKGAPPVLPLVKEQLADHVKKAVQEWLEKNAPQITEPDQTPTDQAPSSKQNSPADLAQNLTIAIERPADIAHGDYSTSIALKLSKQLGMSPHELADKLIAAIPKPPHVEKMEIAGPGFINFFLSQDYLEEELENVLKYSQNYGRSAHGKGKTVLVEYSQPNIAKPLGVHHLLSTIIGQTVGDIYRYAGYNVISLNYLGDWGTQFGKLLYAYKTWGNEEIVKKDPLNELLKLYVQFHSEAEEDPALEDKGRAEFKKLEEGDEENTKLWNWFRDLSIQEINRIYQKLGVRFDEILGESMFLEGAKKVLQEGIEKNIFTKGEKGALVVEFPDEKYPPYMVQKADGTTLYSTRDIASLRERIQRWNPEKLLYVVDVAQKLHFEQFFETSRMLKIIQEKEGMQPVHISFGRMSMPEGRMSTRKGEVILLDEVIKEATSRAEKIVEEKSHELSKEEKAHVAAGMAISSLKYNVISQNRETNIQFDWDKMLSLDGNSAPYLQYALARAKSILRKAKEEKSSSKPVTAQKEKAESPAPILSQNERQTSLFSIEEDRKEGTGKTSIEETKQQINSEKADTKPFSHETEQTLLKTLRLFPEAVLESAEHYKPNTLSTYLYELARAFSAFYNSVHVLTAPSDDLRESRLKLVQATGQVLENGLKVLGISTFERM